MSQAWPVLMLGLAMGSAAAEPRELGQVRERIEALQTSLAHLRTEKGAATEQLAEIERQYGSLANSVRELDAEAKGREKGLGELEARRRVLREGLSRQHRMLAGQARAAYAVGRQEWLKLALNQEDPVRFSRVVIYYSYLDRARTARLLALRQDLESVLALEGQLRAEAARLDEARERIRAEQTRLDEVRRQRRAILSKVENSLGDQSTRLARLQEDESRLETVLSAVGKIVGEIPIAPPDEPRTAPSARSKPAWPVQGEVLQAFGSPRMTGRWDGVLIGAREGSPIRAVSSGRVVFADWLRGYGLLTIIEHGDGVMSLYAFAQSLRKRSGDWVAAGEVVASVGLSGGQSEPGLYFGVRDRGRPIDPLAWCERAD